MTLKPGDRCVWKFPLSAAADQEIMLPKGAQILHVAAQMRDLFLWAIVEPEQPRVRRKICIYGTGHPMHGGCCTNYLGTIHVGVMASLVLHVFDEGELDD